jgi:hypothetical protein
LLMGWTLVAPLDLTVFPVGLRASLHLLEIVEVARYLGPESDSGICRPGDGGHHSTLRIQNGHLCGTTQRLAIRAQLYIDTNLCDGG